MDVTPTTVREEHDRLRERADAVVPVVNAVRAELGAAFDAEVASITAGEYRDAIDAVFADGDRAVNVAGLAMCLRELDVHEDYPGFVVDELLGRELAGVLAGEQPLRLLAEATFHYADVAAVADTRERAGLDDLDAALAAGVQTRLPGWEWRERPNPFEEG
ncbi:hypothetical protein EFA46_006775 [Halarchaeum sp. CBA1220]|uniref:hypothetical protein n=1 Tax=Halarchaeum sp. CBA1220 TaxID=1853682 RepID=UPI000F3A81AB|nr:hypothetical protein [Halarchaeum sp. CBA1220]QLC33916.1 hypothetical protein EFA46_006775 [Halarchaeum sp. CBA1220]